MEQRASVAGKRPAIATEGRWGIASKTMPAALACQGTGRRQEQRFPCRDRFLGSWCLGGFGVELLHLANMWEQCPCT